MRFTSCYMAIKAFTLCLLTVNISVAGTLLSPDDQMVHKSIGLDITLSYNPNPAFLTIEQTIFVKTKADGFFIKGTTDPGRYRCIGTTYVSYQPKGVYEVLVYTDNISHLGLESSLPDSSYSAQYRANAVDTLSGLVPAQPWATGRPEFVPWKLWVLRTACAGQTTAPVYPDGSIDPMYWESTIPATYPPQDNPNLSFYYIPERLAVDINSGEYGSYKKVVASTGDGIKPFRIEVTFGIDLSHSSFTTNASKLNHKKYEGILYFDLVGN